MTAQAAIAADTAAIANADAALSTSLNTTGPQTVGNADGSNTVYAFAEVPPGYTVIVAVAAT